MTAPASTHELMTARTLRTARRKPVLPRFDATVSPDVLAAAVRWHGCAIVESFLPDATDHAKKQLMPYLAATPHSLGSFTGLRTHRTMRLVSKAMATHELITDALIQGTVSRLFAGEAYHHQLHLTEAVQIDPGEKAQSLHRDDGTFPFRHPAPPSVINTIWAADEFTAENGATRVIPGSHLWDDERKGTEDETVPAVMPRGSVLIFDGALHHGGGENRSDDSRLAIILAYSLGWLRPLENPQLAAPPQVAKMLSKELQDLLGYKTHGFLGNFEGQQPTATFGDQVPDVLPAVDLYGEDLEQLIIRRR